MRNETKFKEKISQIASRIAEEMSYEKKEMEEPEEKEVDEAEAEEKVSPDASRLADILDQVKRLEPAFKTINSAAEVKDVIKHVVTMMSNPDLSDANKRSGLNLVLTGMAKAAMAAKSGDVPDVSADDEKKMGVELTGLQEAFNRINRK